MNPVLAPLSAGFRLGVALRAAAYRRGWLRAQRLARPVVSVGNLTLGGTGKTPLIAWIAQRFLARGWKPSILTRGYGRRPGPHLIPIAPSRERSPDPREVGDEPAVLGMSLPQVPIVVGRDRWSAGRMAEERFQADVHLLDDGFQHWALARDVDIVLVDITQEFSDAALLPTGRLREPCSSLARASVVLLTRLELGDSGSIEEQVSRINPQARIFRSTTKFRALSDLASARQCSPTALQGEKVLAFCGLGNPDAFFRDLKQWGFSVVAKEVFRDHHVYTPEDLRRMVVRARKAGATALLTTEKDAVNLPAHWKPEMALGICSIELAIEEAGAFEEALVARLEARR